MNSCVRLLRGFDARNDGVCVLITVCYYLHILILGLVLGEQVEVFAQWAGELWHLFTAMVGSTWGITLPLLDTPVDLQTGQRKRMRGEKLQPWKYNLHHEFTILKYRTLIFTCTRMSARCVSLAWRRSAVLSSWINQDPLLVFRMAAVPWGGRDQTKA